MNARHTAFLIPAFLLAGCGARNGLLSVAGDDTPDSSTDAASPAPDAAADAPVADASALRCPSLVQADGPFRVFGDDGLHDVGPIALARAGGFDVVAFQNNGPGAASHATVARRATIDSSSGLLQWTSGTVLDAEATSLGKAAADGELLGTCQGARNLEGLPTFTFQTHEDSYALHAQLRQYQSDPRCFGIAGHRDRWVAFWMGDDLSLYASEFDSTAQPLTDPQPTGMGSGVQAAAYGSGIAWADSSAGQIQLVFSPDQGGKSVFALPAPETIGSAIVVSRWPWRDDAVALLWEETETQGPPTRFRLRAVGTDGLTISDRQLDGDYSVGAIPMLATMADRLVTGAAEYDAYGADTGLIHVSMIDESGAVIGPVTSFPFERGDLNDDHDVSIAADDDHVLVVWAVRPGLANAGVWATLLTCR